MAAEKADSGSWAWFPTSVTPAVRRLSHGDRELKASLNDGTRKGQGREGVSGKRKKSQSLGKGEGG